MKTHSKEYTDYLKSDKWQKKREQKLREIDHKCEKVTDGDCEGSIQVHHIHYRNLGNENLWDLVVLCQDHHAQADEKRYIKTWVENELGILIDDDDEPNYLSLDVWEAWECRDLEFENDYNENDIIYG